MQMGGGIEFADHRDYTPGDDFRYLDWNLFARHDELLLKRFQEEEDLHVYLLLDCSRSMAFGVPPKFDLARQLTAALAYIALADLDRIAVVGFANDIVADFPLTRGKGRVLSLLRFLEGLQPRGEDTDLARVIAGFVHRDQRRGLAIIVSDLYDPAGFERGLDLLRHRKYEPHIIQLFDRQEQDPQGMLGDIEMLDVENGDTRKVTVTEKNLRQYRKLLLGGEVLKMPFPLDHRFVQQAQEKLGRALPLGYVARMCRNNGGEVSAGGDVFNLYPILDNSDRKRLSRTCNDIVRETALAQEWTNFPPDALAIGDNGGGDKLIFLPHQDDPRYADAVFWWAHETGELQLVADAFEELT
jgi:hypothetical protein